MLIPQDDIVCRFIRPQSNKWHKSKRRPRPDAFNDGRDQKGISLWHRDRLLSRSVPLKDLRLGSLEGSGQIHYTARDYYELAMEAADEKGRPLPIRLEWRTRKEQVTKQWWKWRYAHSEVLLPNDPDKGTLQCFRHLLSIYARKKAKRIVPPDRFK